MPPENIGTLTVQFYVERFSQGRFAPNLGSVLGLDPVISLLAPVILAAHLLIAWTRQNPPHKSEAFAISSGV
jgi:hypothetical protein